MAIREPIVQTRAAPIRRGVQLFRPPDVFTGGEAGLAFTIEEAVLQGRIWQDSAGTTRANKTDDPVGRIDDVSGDGNNLTQSTATARTLLKQTAGGRWHLEFDETDDEYTVTLPDITDGTVVLIGVDGIWIDDAFNHSAGTWTLGFNGGDNNYTGGPAGILTTVGGLLGVTVLDRQLTSAERHSVIDYGISAGAPGHFELGDELVGNGTFDTDTDGWSGARSNETLSVVSGRLRVTADAAGAFGAAYEIASQSAGTYKVALLSDQGSVPGGNVFSLRNDNNADLSSPEYSMDMAGEDDYQLIVTFSTMQTKHYGVIAVADAAGEFFDIDNVSVRKLTLVTA